MTDHARKQIRDLVAAGLAGLPTTGANVFVGRTRPLGAGHPPTLLIYTREETSKRAVTGRPPGLERAVTLHIEGRVSNAAPDDLLDQIALEVEQAIAALIDYGSAKFFNGMAQNVDLKSTASDTRAAGESVEGAIVLIYQVTYQVAEGSPGSIVPASLT